MTYLLLAILCSTSILVSFKFFERLKIETFPAILVNYVVASAFGFLAHPEPFSLMSIPFKPWFPLSLLTGGMLITGFLLFAFSAQKAGITITAISSRMSVVISVILGFWIFKEEVQLLKIIGVMLALAAFYLTFRKKGQRLQWTSLLPLFLFLAQGCNDSLLKTMQHFYRSEDFSLFLATAFLVSLALGSSYYVIRAGFRPKPLPWRSILAGLLLGLLNWFSTLFVLKGLDVYDVSVFIPLLNVSIVSLAAIAGYVLFRERLSRMNLLGILLAILAIVILGSF